MEDAQEKQHEATAKKIEDLKKEGQVLRSKELTSASMVIVGILMLAVYGGHIASNVLTSFKTVYKSIPAAVNNNHVIGEILGSVATSSLLILFPLFICVYITPIISVFIFGGWNITFKAVQFKLDRLSPIKNLSNIYSKRVVIEVLRSFYKVALFISLLYYFVKSSVQELFRLYNHNVSQSVIEFIFILERYILISIIGIATVAMLDMAYSYFMHKEKSKMSTQELKDEHKEVEGNPEVKRKIKQAQMAILKNNIMKAMETADLVIVNPTHYSVAIAYNEAKDNAPRVVAKGKDQIASYIRQLAAKRALPIYEEPRLARAIYRTSKVGAEINPELYMAMAIVLSYLHQLKMYQQGIAELPVKHSDLQIPPEMQFDD